MADNPKRLLVVEDEKPLAQAMDIRFSHDGYKVDVALNGLEGLKLLKKNRYDAVLLDLVMPVMDGFGVLEASRKLKHVPPIIVLSNLSQPEEMQRAISLGAYKTMIKADTPLQTIADEIAAL